MDVVIEAQHQNEIGEMSSEAFKECQKSMGFNANELGLVADEDLRNEFNVSEVLRTDWVHDALQSGMLSNECTLFFIACSTVGLHAGIWERYFSANWSYPAHRRLKTGDLHELFNKFYTNKEEKDKKFKCQASQLLSVFGMVRHLIESQLDMYGHLQPQCASFKSACKLLDLILDSKRSLVAVDLLHFVESYKLNWVEHMELRKAAYGDDKLLPKDHAMVHVGPQIRRDGFPLDMFVIERQNLRVKGVAEPVDNGRRYEMSVLSSLLTQQQNALSELPTLASGLRGPRGPMSGFQGVELAKAIELEGSHFAKGDIVCIGSVNCGFVAACAEEGSAFYIIVQTMVCVVDYGHSGRYRVTDHLQVVAARDVRETTAWYQEGEFWVVVR